MYLCNIYKLFCPAEKKQWHILLITVLELKNTCCNVKDYFDFIETFVFENVDIGFIYINNTKMLFYVFILFWK